MKSIILALLLIIPIANYAQIPQRLREAQALQIYKENGLKGAKDRNDSVIIVPQYSDINYAGDGLWEIKDTSGLSGFIDKYGNIIVPPKYDYVPYEKYNEGFCFVYNKEGGTYIDRQGNPLTAFIYRDGGEFSEGLGAVRGQNGKWGFIDSYGVEVIPCVYERNKLVLDDAPLFSEGLACVSKRGRIRYIDKNGKNFLELPKHYYPVLYWQNSNFKNGRALIRGNNKLAFIDKQGIITKSDKFSRGRVSEVFNNGFCVDDHYNVLNMDFDSVASMKIQGGKWIKQRDKWIEKRDTTLTHRSDDAVFHLANYYLEFHHDGFHDDAFWLLKNIPKNSKAQCTLGDMYYYGIGVEKDVQQAVEWYKKSHEPEAKKQLAMLEGKDKTNISQPAEESKLVTRQESQTIKDNVSTVHQISTTNESMIVTTHQTQSVEQGMEQAAIQKKSQIIEPKKKEKRIALVIGNSDYSKDPIECARNDADDIASIFRENDIKPTINQQNVKTREEFRNVITKFCESAKTADAAIFYYSGHGTQHNDRNYLVPTQAEWDNGADLEGQCVSLNWILQEMVNSGVKTKIIILDACRENHNPRGKKGTGAQGLINMGREALPEGTLIMYAAQPGAVAWQGEKGARNSIYTAELLKLLEDPQIEIHALMYKIQQNVYKATKGKETEQIPDSDSCLTEDFYFKCAQ